MSSRKIVPLYTVYWKQREGNKTSTGERYADKYITVSSLQGTTLETPDPSYAWHPNPLPDKWYFRAWRSIRIPKMPFKKKEMKSGPQSWKWPCYRHKHDIVWWCWLLLALFYNGPSCFSGRVFSYQNKQMHPNHNCLCTKGKNKQTNPL